MDLEQALKRIAELEGELEFARARHAEDLSRFHEAKRQAIARERARVNYVLTDLLGDIAREISQKIAEWETENQRGDPSEP